MTKSSRMFPPERFGETVIAHTPIIKPDGCMPGYIILRETETQYIVHNAQVDEKGEYVAMYWGKYINKSQPDALKSAMHAYLHKAISWHCLANSFIVVTE